MRRLRALLLRLASTLWSRPDDDAAEIETHLDLHIADNVRAGMMPEEARRRALIALGGAAQTVERLRDQRGLPALDALRQDLVHAARILRRNPGFAATLVVTLALGIGANSAIFSIVNATLLRPLPFREPDRLVMIFATDGRRHIQFDDATYPDFSDWRRQSRSFESMAAFAGSSLALAFDDQVLLIRGRRVTPDFFDVLGVAPAIGRGFRAEEDAPGANRVAVLSDGFWKRYFGGDPAALGRVLRIDDEPHVVVGVMPPSFYVDQAADEQVYTPLPIDANRGHGFLRVVGRLRRGTTLSEASAEMAAITRRLEPLYPRTNIGVGTNLVPMADALARRVRGGLLLTLAVVGVVLVIACANVAGLMLARGATRQRELAVRAALGAGRGRLVRQLLTESLVIAAAGGALGLIAAGAAARMLGAIVAEQFEGGARAGLATTDLSVLAFTLIVSVLAGIGSGVVPALAAASPRLSEPLHDAGRGSTGVRAPRVGRALVTAEIALAVVLLAGGAGLLRALLAMRATPPGFDTRNVLVIDLWLPPARFARLPDRVSFFTESLARVRQLPGIRDAAFVADLPLNGATDSESFHIVGRRDPLPDRSFNAGFNIASAGYFRAIGTPIREGRDFVEADGPNTPGVAVVNETAARKWWPDRSPVGQQILVPITREKSQLLTIVGVAADVRHSGLGVPPRPEIFVHSMQSELQSGTHWPWVVLAVRVSSSPLALADSVRTVLRQVDPNVPIRRVSSGDAVVARSMTEPRTYTWLLGSFALLAGVLASIGLYGLVSYSVSQRTHELGIRVALGASRRDILGLVLAQGMSLALAGSVIGLAAAVSATRLLIGLVAGVRPNDPLTLGAVTVLLLGVAALASFVPARRAARVDPIVALRAE